MILLSLLTSRPANFAASILYLVEMSMFAVLATSFLSSVWTLLAPLHSLASQLLLVVFTIVSGHSSHCYLFLNEMSEVFEGDDDDFNQEEV